MRTHEDIEAYLIRTGAPCREVAQHTWIIREQNDSAIVVKLEGDLVLFRAKVADLATLKDREALFAKLLTLNATDMLHGAYAIADDAIVLTSALRLENLDYNEFQGTIDDFSMALSNHRALVDASKK